MGIDASAVARVVGIDTQFKDLRAGAALFLAQHIAIIAQGNTDANGDYPLTPWDAPSAQQGAARYGYGSPIHQALRELHPITGGGVAPIRVTVLPLNDDGAGVAAAGTITPSGAAPGIATYWVSIAGILSAPFTTAAGDSVAAIIDKMVAAVDAVLEMPMDAADGTTELDLTCKWKGASGNDLTVEVLDSTGLAPVSGLTFTIVQPASGAADPSVAPALALLGSDWVTMVINGLGPSNTTALGLIAAAGEGRWDKLVRKPFVCFTGNPEAVVGTATTVPAARPSDRVNAQLVSPGSVHLPVQIAAAQVREIAKVANNNPPTDYGGRAVRSLIPGADNLQWDHAERDLAVKAGSSTVEVKDGIVRISDVVTMYHPAGEVPPAYRHVVDIVKLQTIIYNFDLEFTKPEWNGAPLIPDGQPTANPNARTPKAAKAAACAIIDGLALQAIISDPVTAKKNTVASVNSQNPKRLDLSTTVQLSGNTNIISVDLNFGFFFGAPTVVG
jgi:phage tail sheath gpL-like